ncbi:hypothetical protein DZB91_24060 [Brevibacillus sp. VP]|uniref:conjugal transfer protein TrbL family protein n=1 Tax=Brevibacillus sp. VP TaxID=2293326 RepID=UPI000E2F1566|nr:conjugal transfer protein TrbL family protein [Brevibacillus sp. VP]RFB28278.1 hypothetical protein DZB91_24060 [Brevibacillus sp. VP]
MSYPTNLLGWISFLLIPRLPRVVEKFIGDLFKKIPYRNNYLITLVLIIFILFPTAVFAFGPVDWGKQVISDWLYETVEAIAQEAYTGIHDFLLQPTSLSEYSVIKEVVECAQVIAGALLILVSLYEMIKIAGLSTIGGNEESPAGVIKNAIYAAFLIYFMPWSVDNLLIPANNFIMDSVSQISVHVTEDLFKASLNPAQIKEKAEKLSVAIVLMFLVYVIAVLILSIVAGIRYVEIIISLVISPFIAVNVGKGGDLVGVWIRETTAIIFTQCVHMLLLNFLFNFIGEFDFWGMLKATGVIVVMLRGPQVLRQFLYSSGSGGFAVGMAGQGGRLAAFKMMTKSLKPV